MVLYVCLSIYLSIYLSISLMFAVCLLGRWSYDFGISRSKFQQVRKIRYKSFGCLFVTLKFTVTPHTCGLPDGISR